MREIKFRALEPLNKKMYYLDLAFTDEQGNFILPPNKQCVTNKYTIMNRDALVLMQFTGLRDKNGKEIYEGDILQQHPHKKRWMVEYYGGAFELIEKGKFAGHLCFMNEDDIEVIGNIHENPELMEAI